VLALTLGLGALATMLAAGRLKLDALPDVTSNQVQLLTQAPGYTPEEVERLVTRPIEIALGGLPGLATQRSLSRYGLSVVTAVFHDDVDLVRARQLVAERLVGLPQLPAGVETPELGPLTGGLGEIFHFAVEGEGYDATQILELVELRIALSCARSRAWWRSTPGVATRRTMDVIGDPIAMAAHGVSLAELQAAVSTLERSRAGGRPRGGRGARAHAWPSRSPPSHGTSSDAVCTPLRAARRSHRRRGSVRGAEPRLGTATAEGRGEVRLRDGPDAARRERARGAGGIHARAARGARRAAQRRELEVIYDRSDPRRTPRSAPWARTCSRAACSWCMLFPCWAACAPRWWWP
jgi:cobalt-zinc-cadmium resistance protein CzcA